MMKTLQPKLLNYITSKICNFKSLDNIQFLEDESDENYQCYKLAYYTNPSGFHVCRVEIDLNKEKFSIGVDGDSFLGTFRFSLSVIKVENTQNCVCNKDEFSLFC